MPSNNTSDADFATRLAQYDPSVNCVQFGLRAPESLALSTHSLSAGAAFFALQGTRSDGRDFITQAIQQGACWIVTDQRPFPTAIQQDLPSHVGLISVREPRAVLAKLAADWYGAAPRNQILITGTNGKSSVAEYIVQLGQALQHSTASIGTLGVRGAGEMPEAPALTSPDSIALHQMLALLHTKGVSTVAIEASSHGLEQYRLDGTRPRIGVFTGLGRDHLDYHANMQAYLQAKLGLFSRLLSQDSCALYAAEHEGASQVLEICRKRGITAQSYGTAQSDFAISQVHAHDGGIECVVTYQQQRALITLPLWGIFQLYNALAAAACWVNLGVNFATVFAAIKRLKPVPGRLELCGTTKEGAKVFVDYAHTPDALQTVLRHIRPHCAGRLVLVFGCGGDRDQGKRAEMGAIAARDADSVVVTDDNPRSEEPAAIRAMVMAACPKACEIGDRREAIRQAIDEAKAGDYVIVAGKGHESGQIIGTTVLALDDREIVRDYLSEIGA